MDAEFSPPTTKYFGMKLPVKHLRCCNSPNFSTTVGGLYQDRFYNQITLGGRSRLNGFRGVCVSVVVVSH